MKNKIRGTHKIDRANNKRK